MTESKQKTKKKTVSKKIKTVEINKPDNMDVIQNKLVPEKIKFEPFTVLNETKYELNYLSIRRKIISFGQKIGLIKNDNKIVTPKYLTESAINPITGNNWRFYINNLWYNYCNWFNRNFNKKE